MDLYPMMEVIRLLFTDPVFLFVFFPVVVLVSYALRGRLRNLWLLVASLFFYAWGEPKFVFVLMGSVLFNYCMALPLDQRCGLPKKWRRVICAAAAMANIALIFLYKYYGFASSVITALPGWSFALPIGISFFTFQALSYVIDVYRGAEAQSDPFDLALYITLFPQLVAGPIVRYGTIREQLRTRHVGWDDFSDGLLRFVVGFNKKMLLANVLGELADRMFGLESVTFLPGWLGALAYMLQIYYDFSGYSDMAIGIGRMLGFTFPENFDLPYIAKSITEFWRRWHMSLGTWFRDYVYIPLGGSRVDSKARLAFNLAVTWLATGLWHGASWNFIAWGALYGMLLIFEKLTGKKCGRLLTLLLVLFGWVLFRAESLPAAWQYMRGMFDISAVEGLFWLREYAVYLIAGIALATPLSRKLPKNEVLCWCVQLVLLAVGISFIAMQTHNPFIYFNF